MFKKKHNLGCAFWIAIKQETIAQSQLSAIRRIKNHHKTWIDKVICSLFEQPTKPKPILKHIPINTAYFLWFLISIWHL